MKIFLNIFIIFIMFSVPANAENKYTTFWSITVHNSLGENKYKPQENGGFVPGTGLVKNCYQEPMNIIKNKNGDLQQKVRINCEIGFNSKVSLIQSCYLFKLDNSWGALSIDDGPLSKFTIELSCITFIN